MKTVSNENGLSLEIIHAKDISNNDKTAVILGGDSTNPGWKEYVFDFKEQYHPHLELIKKAIEENGMMGYTGQDADNLWFHFSDGQIWGFSWRAWGDLMQAIVNKNEGYMKYYM